MGAPIEIFMLNTGLIREPISCLDKVLKQSRHVPNDSVGPKALTVLTPIFAIGILFYAVRIYTRVVPKYKLNVADWACTIATLAGSVTYTRFAAAVSFGFRKHSIYVSHPPVHGILQCLFE